MPSNADVLALAAMVEKELCKHDSAAASPRTSR